MIVYINGNGQVETHKRKNADIAGWTDLWEFWNQNDLFELVKRGDILTVC